LLVLATGAHKVRPYISRHELKRVIKAAKRQDACDPSSEACVSGVSSVASTSSPFSFLPCRLDIFSSAFFLRSISFRNLMKLCLLRFAKVPPLSPYPRCGEALQSDQSLTLFLAKVAVFAPNGRPTDRRSQFVGRVHVCLGRPGPVNAFSTHLPHFAHHTKMEFTHELLLLSVFLDEWLVVFKLTTVRKNTSRHSLNRRDRKVNKPGTAHAGNLQNKKPSGKFFCPGRFNKTGNKNSDNFELKRNGSCFGPSYERFQIGVKRLFSQGKCSDRRQLCLN